MGDLKDIVVESLRVLDRRWKGVVPVVQLGEEVVLLQAKLPKGPGLAWIVHSPEGQTTWTVICSWPGWMTG